MCFLRLIKMEMNPAYSIPSEFEMLEMLVIGLLFILLGTPSCYSSSFLFLEL